MSVTLDEARAEAARVISEHDAQYGSPAQWEAQKAHERAFQQRRAEREKQKQVEKDRVAAQARQAVQQQQTEAYWQGQATFIYDCIEKYFHKNFATFFNPHYEAYSEAEAKHLVKVLGEVVANLRREWTGLVGKRTAELTTREQTNTANEKFSERINALERELATVKGELRSARDMAAQFRNLEQGLAARQVDARFAELERALDSGQAERQKTALLRDELLERIAGLEHRIADLEKVAAQAGTQGPPGPPGKLPRVKEYVAERVHYESDVVTHAGGLWQAQCDTVHAPPHVDWICLARAGRDGLTPTIRGTYDVYGKYKKLDIVALDGAAFIARRDDPGVCPGDHWQMISRQGRPGRPGETGKRGAHGEKGEPGEPGVTFVSWQLDRQRYRVSPLMSDGTVGPMLEMRELFEQFLYETS